MRISEMRFLKLSFALAILSSSAFAQKPMQKDPQTALVLSIIIPGGGQIYAGEGIKGGLMLLGSTAAIVTGYATSQRTQCAGHNGGVDNCDGPHWTNLYIGAGVDAFIWFASMIDAPSAARRYNARIQPMAQLKDGERRFGLAVSF